MNDKRDQKNRFPKKVPVLTPEQKKIKDDFMKYWLEVSRTNYGIYERFNHQTVVKNKPTKFLKTLEIGAGLGEHLAYEDLNEDQKKNYYAMDMRENVLQILKKENPEINAILGDCEEGLEFTDNFFDRVIAIHVLEHMPDLPKALTEISRVLKSDGIFHVVIPCEGSLAHQIARKISAERLFKKKYNTSYDWFIKSEHLSVPFEIFEELEKKFHIIKKNYFPIPVPFEFCNLCIGIHLKKKF